MKHQKTARRAKPVTRKSESSTYVVLTLEQVREAVEMAWTDATHLPERPGSFEVCEHLRYATERLDEMIERRGKVSGARSSHMVSLKQQRLTIRTYPDKKEAIR